MAIKSAVWGIDIGQCALKAMRCRAHDDSDKIIVDAFDYIEYPKILTQPDANPIELVSDALKQFLSRNQVHNDRVAVSVSGQSGLARFIKLPPVEAKKIPDIVRYEARQQIPFDLNDVIWDFQRMGGGTEESGFVLETEIGLFAMKRDAVFRALEPFVKAGIEVDIVQLRRWPSITTSSSTCCRTCPARKPTIPTIRRNRSCWSRWAPTRRTWW